MSDWISVEERLPEDGDHVLVSTVQYGKRQPTEKAEYVAGSVYKWFATNRDVDVIDGVTHWMPLPEAPEDE